MSGRIGIRVDGDLATVTLDNPGKLNAIDASMWSALEQGFGELSANTDLRCIIVAGADGAFAAGGDLVEMRTARSTLEGALAYHAQVGRALDAIASCTHPVIARIDGACVGGGLEIACACDLRIAGESSRFGAPICRLGFSMYPDELRGLLKLAGAAVVKEILIEGRLLDAREACAKGLVTRVVADEATTTETMETARRIASGAPLVARWHKQWIARLETGVPLTDAERQASFAFLDSADYQEGVAAFLEKRPPRFTGR